MTVFPVRNKFRAEDKDRFSLTFPTLKQANQFKHHYELSQIEMTATSLRYFRSLNKRQQAVLERVGVLEPVVEQKPRKQSVGWLCRHAKSELTYLADNTKKAHRQASASLIEHFGFNHPLSSITPQECVKWQRKLLKAKSQTTVATFTSIAKQYFAMGVELGLMSRNPLAKSQVKLARTNPDRTEFITQDRFRRILSFCDDPYLSNTLVLARFCGVRVPSEIKSMKWSDIDYSKNVLTIKDVKRDRTRYCPLFPEVRDLLVKTDGLVCKPEGNTYGLKKLFEKSGISWAKKFINLRSSRETELNDQGYPAHVVAAWIGHSVRVAQDHYLQVSSEQWGRAVG